MNKEKEEDRVLQRFRVKKVMTISQLVSLFDCTERSVQRKLHKWQAISSYNRNGKYYVLPEIPNYDKYGIWRYRQCYFSKYGNLKETLIHLVKSSTAGLSGSEVGSLLRLDPRSFLSHFRDHPQLFREKIKGRFIYFSHDEKIRKVQIQRRHEQDQGRELPTDAEAILILVEFIRSPQSSDQDLCERLRKNGMEVTPEMVAKLFDHHNLAKKN
jgi:hypothetical protein